MKTKDMTLISVCATMLIVAKQVLSFLPNVQIITLLVLIFSKSFKFKTNIFIVSIFVTIDSLIMGGFSIMYFPSMLIGWMLIPICVNTFLKTENIYKLSVFGLIHSSIYGFLFLLPRSVLTDVDVSAYIIMDIPFQIIMGTTSFLSILFLYEPLKKGINKII